MRVALEPVRGLPGELLRPPECDGAQGVVREVGIKLYFGDPAAIHKVFFGPDEHDYVWCWRHEITPV